MASAAHLRLVKSTDHVITGQTSHEPVKPKEPGLKTFERISKKTNEGERRGAIWKYLERCPNDDLKRRISRICNAGIIETFTQSNEHGRIVDYIIDICDERLTSQEDKTDVLVMLIEHGALNHHTRLSQMALKKLATSQDQLTLARMNLNTDKLSLMLKCNKVFKFSDTPIFIEFNLMADPNKNAFTFWFEGEEFKDLGEVIENQQFFINNPKAFDLTKLVWDALLFAHSNLESRSMPKYSARLIECIEREIFKSKNYSKTSINSKGLTQLFVGPV